MMAQKKIVKKRITSADLKRRVARRKRQREAQRAKLGQRHRPKMPTPPTRRRAARQSAAATLPKQIDEALKEKIDHALKAFEDVEDDAQFESAYTAVSWLDERLRDVPFELDELRKRGYVHAGQLDDRLEALDAEWDKIRVRVQGRLRAEVDELEKSLYRVERRVEQLERSPNTLTLRTVEQGIENLEEQVSTASRELDSLIDPVQSGMYKIESLMREVEQMLDWIDESPEIVLVDTEGPILATEAQWQRSGDEGPEGVLVLTDQRLFFEERDEIVTKRRFGIFKQESEFVFRVLVAVPVSQIETVSGTETGRFRKKEFLHLTCSPEADVARLKFRLLKSDSTEWASMINRVQSGDVDDDRADEFVEEVESAEALAAQFPAHCPNCFAETPEVQRGITEIACEYCGGIIRPLESDPNG